MPCPGVAIILITPTALPRSLPEEPGEDSVGQTQNGVQDPFAIAFLWLLIYELGLGIEAMRFSVLLALEETSSEEEFVTAWNRCT
jgi:hypothetical protein